MSKHYHRMTRIFIPLVITENNSHSSHYSKTTKKNVEDIVSRMEIIKHKE